MLKARLICGDLEFLDMDLQECDEIVNLLTEGFFTLVRKGLRAELQLQCNQIYLKLGLSMSAKYASECIYKFFEEHTERVLRDEGKSEVVFKVIEGSESQNFFISQEKGN